jgi:hypothetical protein
VCESEDAMKSRARQFASLRLPAKMKAEVEKMAALERRSLSAMLLILVEEALGRREAKAWESTIATGAMEKYGKIMGQ